MIKKNWLVLGLVGIFIAAFVVRVYQLNLVPIELFGDEIDVGLQANSILKTGNDYLGNTFPVMFHSFAEYRLPLFIYSDVPFVALFGLNEWGVRFSGVFWGMLGVLGMYLLSNKLLGRKVALISTGLLAFSAWHIQLSRQGGVEAIMLLTFLIFGVWSFLKGLDKFSWLIISVVIFGLSFYTYAIADVLTPLFILMLLGLYPKKLRAFGLRKAAVLLVVLVVVLLPFINITLQQKSTNRFSNISILHDSKIIQKDIDDRRKQENLSFGSAVWHNKVLSFTDSFLHNYLESFSSEFLIIRGDPNLRQSVADRGQLYIFEVIILLLGVYFFIVNKKFPKLLIGWLILSPIPAGLTIGGGNHASRLLPMLIPLEIIAAVGLSFLFERKRLKSFQVVIAVVAVLALINISSYLYRYYYDWSKDSWKFWQYGYKQAVTYIKAHDSEYSKIYFNNSYEPALPRFLFWYGYDPALFQQQFKTDKPTDNLADGFSGFSLGDKYFFGTITDADRRRGLSVLLKQNELYMVSSKDEAFELNWANELPVGLHTLKTVFSPFNDPIFYIVAKR